MPTKFIYVSLTMFALSVLYFVYSLFSNFQVSPLVFVTCCIYGYPVFKNTLNLIQGVGPFYWITRDNHSGFSIGLGFMRETGFPWRNGRGLHIGILKYSFQIGLCRKSTVIDEYNGMLRALQGRELDHHPSKLRDWK